MLGDAHEINGALLREPAPFFDEDGTAVVVRNCAQMPQGLPTSRRSRRPAQIGGDYHTHIVTPAAAVARR